MHPSRETRPAGSPARRGHNVQRHSFGHLTSGSCGAEEVTYGVLHQLMRKVSGNWVNLVALLPGLAQGSRGGQAAGGGHHHSVAADAASTPQRSRTWLSTQPGDPPRRLYCESCPNVQMDSVGRLMSGSCDAEEDTNWGQASLEADLPMLPKLFVQTIASSGVQTMRSARPLPTKISLPRDARSTV